MNPRLQRGIRAFPLVPLALVVVIAACGQPKDPDSTFGRELVLGDRGDDVRRLNEYLTNLGYFPNAELARTQPRWRPAVAETPVDPSTFDSLTAAAVMHYQARMRLTQTGLVDSETLTALNTARCGNPDEIEPLDGADKFALFSNFSFPSSFTWTVTNSPTCCITKTQAIASATAAVGAWTGQTNLTGSFRNTTPANLTVKFGDCGVAGWIACAGGGTITLNNSTNWFADGTLLSVLIHEFGHGVGLDHSSFQQAIMFPSRNSTNALDPDDMVSVSLRYDTYQSVGTATDVGAGGSLAAPALWAINGVNIMQFNQSTRRWVQASGSGSRIAVGPDGTPWITNTSGQIFRATTNDATTLGWTQLPGCADDIGVSANGTAWMVQCGGLVFQWLDGQWFPDTSRFLMKRIAVDEQGFPWAVDSSGDVWRRTSASSFDGSWLRLPRPTGGATDVGAYTRQFNQSGSSTQVGGPGGIVWAIGSSSVSAWNEQPSCCTGDPAPSRAKWIVAQFPRSGSTNAISVGPTGAPFFIGGDRAIMTSVR